MTNNLISKIDKFLFESVSGEFKTQIDALKKETEKKSKLVKLFVKNIEENPTSKSISFETIIDFSGEEYIDNEQMLKMSNIVKSDKFYAIVEEIARDIFSENNTFKVEISWTDDGKFGKISLTKRPGSLSKENLKAVKKEEI